jgi:hypothetical protein
MQSVCGFAISRNFSVWILHEDNGKQFLTRVNRIIIINIISTLGFIVLAGSTCIPAGFFTFDCRSLVEQHGLAHVGGSFHLFPIWINPSSIFWK